jgi:hypothetical protein
VKRAVLVALVAALAGCGGGDDSGLTRAEAAKIIDGWKKNIQGEPLRDPQITRLVKNNDGRYSAFVDQGDAPDLCFHIRLLDDEQGWSLARCRN